MSAKVKRTQEIDLLISGGLVVTPSGARMASVGVHQGRIVSVSDSEIAPAAREVIDATGKVVIPGVVDPETHLGGNNSLLDDLKTETRAAAAGGVTTWGLQLTSAVISRTYKRDRTAADLVPYSEKAEELISIGDEVSLVDYFLTGMINTDAQALDIPRVAEDWGVTSYKFYLHAMNNSALRHSGWYAAPRYGITEGFDDGTIYLALEAVGQIGAPGIVSLHCENYEIARIFQDRLQRAGRRDMKAWDERSPHFLEVGHLRTYAYYAGVVGCPIYLQHTTTRSTLDEVRRIKAEGQTIYTQSAAHYLVLDHNTWKLNVPLRDPATQEELWAALVAGEIDALGSDHINSPGRREDLWKDNVWESGSGFASRVEGHLPLMLSEGVNKGRVSLERLVEVMCTNPAKVFGLYPRKGVIECGADADLVLIDLDRVEEVSNDMVLSKAGWTILAGRTLKGWPVRTILRGKTISQWPIGERRATVASETNGRYLRRELRNNNRTFPVVARLDDRLGL